MNDEALFQHRVRVKLPSVIRQFLIKYPNIFEDIPSLKEYMYYYLNYDPQYLKNY